MSQSHSFPYASSSGILRQFLKGRVPSSELSTIVERVTVHPDYPALSAFVAALNSGEDRCTAGRVAPTDLAQLATPFLAQLLGQGLVSVLDVGETTITYLTQKDDIVRATREDFEFDFSGVVLLYEADLQSKTPSGSADRTTLVPDAWLAVALLASLLLSFVSPTGAILLIGLLGSYFIAKALYFAIDPDYTTQTCGAGFTDCGSFLRSTHAVASKRWNLSWTEIGGGYFLTLIGITIVSHIDSTMLPLLPLFSWLPLTFFPYSLYVQRIQLGWWCALCLRLLTVLAVLAVVGGTVAPASWPTTYSVLLMVGLMAGSTLLLTRIRSVLTSVLARRTDHLRYQRLALSKCTFERVHVGRKEIIIPKNIQLPLSDPAPIAATAPNVVIVIKPACGYCQALLKEMMQDRLYEQLSVSVVVASGQDADPYLNKLIRAGNPLTRRSLLIGYFAERKLPSDFPTQMPVTPTNSDTNYQVMVREWTQLHGITRYPQLIVNNKQLNHNYRLQDVARLQ